MRKFEVGKEYSARSLCDYDCIFSFTILKRTAKSVWIKVHGRIKRKKIEIYDDGEVFSPLGKYSMSLIVRA